jgi:hypothetical protein
VNNSLGDDNIRGDMSIGNKGWLSLINIIWEMVFDPIG